MQVTTMVNIDRDKCSQQLSFTLLSIRWPLLNCGMSPSSCLITFLMLLKAFHALAPIQVYGRWQQVLCRSVLEREMANTKLLSTGWWLVRPLNAARDLGPPGSKRSPVVMPRSHVQPLCRVSGHLATAMISWRTELSRNQYSNPILGTLLHLLGYVLLYCLAD